MIAIAITTILVSIILGLVAIVCVHVFADHKYGNSNRLAVLEEQMEAWTSEKRLNPKEVHERLVALENRAGVMIGRK